MQTLCLSLVPLLLVVFTIEILYSIIGIVTFKKWNSLYEN